MTMAGSPQALRVRDLRKRYKDVVAVDGIDLDVASGECFGLLGPNGAGKTTTIEICEGLTVPDGGDVEVLGLRWTSDADQLRRRLGIQLQDTQLSDKQTVVETLRLFRSFYACGPSPDELVALVHLQEKRDARIASLSGGQKQRLALAIALVGDPDLLFLDEPTTGLDPQARRQRWDLIEDFKRSGRTILLTTHYMEEAQRLSDRIAILRNGRIALTGSPRELLSGQALVEIRYRRNGEEIVIDTEEPTRVLHELTTKALADGVELEGLEVHRRSLEDVYLDLTRVEAEA
jgi:ABC-2 type transport system ATP-binding protein